MGGNWATRVFGATVVVLVAAACGGGVRGSPFDDDDGGDRDAGDQDGDTDQLPGDGDASPVGLTRFLNTSCSLSASAASTVFDGLASSSLTGLVPVPGVLKARVKQFVHAHLADPALSLDLIAQQLRCSKRYLHRVFEDEDQTLDRFIWQMRLERCSEALRSAAGRRISVSEIAFAWGFNSSAHFCRVFKSQYGVSPREFQRREAERALASAALTH